MPTFSYPILCLEPNCGRPATHKIAARWSDGQTHELKTYGLVCERCLPAKLEASRAKNAACGRAEGETLDPPRVFRLDTGALVEPLPDG